MTPELTVIANFYNMRREAARTLFTLSAEYQRNVDSAQYRVLALDNGSTEPLDRSEIEGFGPNFRYHYYETSSPSPVEAINWAVEQAETPWIAVLIDGARMLSPGVLRYMLLGFRTFEHPLVYTLGMHLGPETQNRAIVTGYSREQEDKLLDQIDWRQDGYGLFGVSSLAGSSYGGFLSRPHESNCFALARADYLELGGYDKRFQSPGGGLANLDFFNRAGQFEPLEPIMLLGEATFHQIHGGVATNVPLADHPWPNFAEEYQRIRQHPYVDLGNGRPQRFLGHLPPGCEALLAPAAPSEP